MCSILLKKNPKSNDSLTTPFLWTLNQAPLLIIFCRGVLRVDRFKLCRVLQLHLLVLTCKEQSSILPIELNLINLCLLLSHQRLHQQYLDIDPQRIALEARRNQTIKLHRLDFKATQLLTDFIFRDPG